MYTVLLIFKDISISAFTQWAKSPKKQSVCIFDNIALYLSAKLTKTHSFRLFLAILPTCRMNNFYDISSLKILLRFSRFFYKAFESMNPYQTINIVIITFAVMLFRFEGL